MTAPDVHPIFSVLPFKSLNTSSSSLDAMTTDCTPTLSFCLIFGKNKVMTQS